MGRATLAKEVAVRVLLRIFALVLLGLHAPCAEAALTRQQIEQTGFSLDASTRLPADIALDDTHKIAWKLGALLGNRPALLLFVDYRCETLCGVLMTQLADAMETLPLAAGRDYNLLVVGLDPASTAQDATAFRDARIAGTIAAHKGIFLHADRAALESLMRAAGLTVAWDAEHRQFAHPAGVLVINHDGKPERVLDALSLTPRDLRLALSDSAEPSTLPVASRLLLTCYGWDPATGLYTLRIERLLTMACIACVCGIAVLVFLLHRRRPPAIDLA